MNHSERNVFNFSFLFLPYALFLCGAPAHGNKASLNIYSNLLTLFVPLKKPSIGSQQAIIISLFHLALAEEVSKDQQLLHAVVSPSRFLPEARKNGTFGLRPITQPLSAKRACR